MTLPGAAVLDTSVLVRLLHDHGDRLQGHADTLRDAWLEDRIQLIALDLAVYEFVNVVARRLGHATRAESDVEALFRLQLPMIQVDVSLAREAARLAIERQLSGYDAAFVAAARGLGVPLVTADRQLAVSASADALFLDVVGS